MKLQEIVDRLKAEFPTRTVAFSMHCWHHGSGQNIEVKIWDDGLRTHIDGLSLDDCIAKLHARIAEQHAPEVQPDADVEPSVETMYRCMSCGTQVPESQKREHAKKHNTYAGEQDQDLIDEGYAPC